MGPNPLRTHSGNSRQPPPASQAPAVSVVPPMSPAPIPRPEGSILFSESLCSLKCFDSSLISECWLYQPFPLTMKGLWLTQLCSLLITALGTLPHTHTLPYQRSEVKGRAGTCGGTAPRGMQGICSQTVEVNTPHNYISPGKRGMVGLQYWPHPLYLHSSTPNNPTFPCGSTVISPCRLS